MAVVKSHSSLMLNRPRFSQKKNKIFSLLFNWKNIIKLKRNRGRKSSINSLTMFAFSFSYVLPSYMILSNGVTVTIPWRVTCCTTTLAFICTICVSSSQTCLGDGWIIKKKKKKMSREINKFYISMQIKMKKYICTLHHSEHSRKYIFIQHDNSTIYK